MCEPNFIRLRTPGNLQFGLECSRKAPAFLFQQMASRGHSAFFALLRDRYIRPFCFLNSKQTNKQSTREGLSTIKQCYFCHQRCVPSEFESKLQITGARVRVSMGPLFYSGQPDTFVMFSLFVFLSLSLSILFFP